VNPKALLSWSSGKDSAFALHEVRQAGRFDVAGLLTTVTQAYSRVSMHGVREEILDYQARAAGLPCWKVQIPAGCVNADYETAMGEALERARRDGVTQVIFGDLFLEDVRAYREKMLQGSGIQPVFPLWGRDTRVLAAEMIAAGLKAVVVCVDPRKLPASFAGRTFDAGFLSELPAGIDPCGENGEFHTCVTAGPMFTESLPVRLGEVVSRDGFVFGDLLLDDAVAPIE